MENTHVEWQISNHLLNLVVPCKYLTLAFTDTNVYLACLDMFKDIIKHVHNFFSLECPRWYISQ